LRHALHVVLTAELENAKQQRGECQDAVHDGFLLP
jgi:hypothetical protein